MDNLVDDMLEIVEKVGSTDMHVEFEGVHGVEGKSVVVSVFNKVNPAHKVLEALLDWAAEENMEVYEKIKEVMVLKTEETI